MPWFEYVCEKCGERVARNSSLKHRDVALFHTEDESCGGRLHRAGPLLGPASAGTTGRKFDASAPGSKKRRGPRRT